MYLVETVDGYLDAVDYLKTCSVIGFDSEWKPTRSPGALGRMALLQVASDDKVSDVTIYYTCSFIKLSMHWGYEECHDYSF